MAKLLPYPHTMDLCEAFQANDMKFAFVNPKDDNFQMIHPYVKCREYFNEMLMKNHHPEFEFVKTHGFDYRVEEFPLDMSATRIAVKFKDAKQKEVFLDNLKWIHSIETINNVDLTQVCEINSAEVVLLSSKLWIQKCVLTNIYTLMVKLAALDISSKPLSSFISNIAKPSEIAYVDKVSAPVFNAMLENCTIIAEIPTKYVDGTEEIRHPSIVHVSSGILYLHRIQKETKNPMELFLSGLSSIFKGKFNNEFVKA